MSEQDTPALPLQQIVIGDCIEAMNGWPADGVDLIFADPPYNIGYAYDGHYDDNRDHDEYVSWTGAWTAAGARLLKPSGSFYVLIGDEYAAETRLHLRKLENDRRLLFRNWIIWHYTFGQNCKLKFNRSHAHLFYCVGSAAFKTTRRRRSASKGTPALNINTVDPPFTFNREEIAVPSARQTTYNDRRANPSGKLPDDTWYLRPQEATGTCFKADEDTWYESRLCGTFKERQQWHPCQLPEALLERIVQVSSDPGDLVFDPFVGSGTTLAVARKLGRRWLGCELSPEYGARALERIHADPSPEAKVVTRRGKRPGAASRPTMGKTEAANLFD